MFNFDFNIVKNGVPFVTISTIGLAFNQAAVASLKCPKHVIVGFDKEKNVIGVKACQDEVLSGLSVYEFSARLDRSGWVRLSMRDFIKYLTLSSGFDFRTSKRFMIESDNEYGTMLIYVDNKHLMNAEKSEFESETVNEDGASLDK